MNDIRIAVIGLGYVGLPLACMFASKYPVVGFDVNVKRVKKIAQGIDDTEELCDEDVAKALAAGLTCTSNPDDIARCNVYIVAVPTPVDEFNKPVLDPLENASRTVGKYINKGDVVIYESTVYPGTTEEVCAPIIEEESSLKLNKDFYLGYSPERINPGDKEHTVWNIVKITSGSCAKAADFIDRLYGSVLLNGTYRAPSIQIAEAAKVLENSQRDINIAFINEIAKIFNVLGLNSEEVIKAASSKWNFLHFHPGLVGGHCIGVDPYYLIQRSELKGFTPKLMSEARRINDTLGFYVAERVTAEMNRRGITVRESNILLLGFSFKENCHDIRNTKVADVYAGLSSFTPQIKVFDPLVNSHDANLEYGISTISNLDELRGEKFDAIIQCVNHNEFNTLDIQKFLSPHGFIFYIYPPEDVDIDTKTKLSM